jgi:hypothetical protein
MYAYELEALDSENLCKLVRALGTNRYVRSVLHEVHAFAVLAAAPEAFPALAAWAAATLEDPDIEADSRDPRLVRQLSHAELHAVLSALWSDDDSARDRLLAIVQTARIDVPEGLPAFAAADDDALYPRLVDAGVELWRLAELDLEKHKGAMARFGDALAFQSVVHEETCAVPELPPPMLELPILSIRELTTHPSDWDAPFPIWAQGDPRYIEYVLEGACKVAGARWDYAE